MPGHRRFDCSVKKMLWYCPSGVCASSRRKRERERERERERDRGREVFSAPSSDPARVMRLLPSRFKFSKDNEQWHRSACRDGQLAVHCLVVRFCLSFF